MPTFGVPQITLEGSRDQNLRGSAPPPLCKVGLRSSIREIIKGVLTHYKSKFKNNILPQLDWIANKN